MSINPLLTPIQLGALTLPNRVLMAPLTRCRATRDHVPTQLMAEHYAQRATGGLLIAEATMIDERYSAFHTEPGIYGPGQIAGWRTVTDAVHARHGRIFLQIWHSGRASHPALNGGHQPVAPSAIPITNDKVHTPEGQLDHVTPHALDDAELPGIVQSFRQAAVNAKEAGFDGVEIHGANGYLLDEFLRDGANMRTGPYGGPAANRARLMLEVTEAVCDVWGADRVGLRVSPLNSYNSMIDSDPVGTYTWLAGALNDFGLAYLHVMRADVLGIQNGEVLGPIRAAYRGVLVANMGYTPESGADAVATGTADAIAFGTPFLANPDLPRRIELGAPLNPPDPATFYTSGPEGYVDYPFLA